CNYVRWTRELDLQANNTTPGIGRAYLPPMNFQGTFPYLYHNEGNGKFTDVSRPSGVQVTNPATGLPMAKSLALAPVDIDNDGWIDLVVANDTVPNFLFSNQRDGTFKELGARAGVAFDAYGVARGATGYDAARSSTWEPPRAPRLVTCAGAAGEMRQRYLQTDRRPRLRLRRHRRRRRPRRRHDPDQRPAAAPAQRSTASPSLAPLEIDR